METLRTNGSPPDLRERLRDPATVAALHRLLDRLDDLERLAALLDRAPAFVATAVDTFDDLALQAADRGLDVEKGVLQGAEAAVRFGAMMGPAQIDALQAVLHSGVLAPEAVDVIAGAGRALVEARTEPVPRVGPVGALRALRDPDVQRALGFLTRFAHHLGRQLEKGR